MRREDLEEAGGDAPDEGIMMATSARQREMTREEGRIRGEREERMRREDLEEAGRSSHSHSHGKQSIDGDGSPRSARQKSLTREAGRRTVEEGEELRREDLRKANRHRGFRGGGGGGATTGEEGGGGGGATRRQKERTEESGRERVEREEKLRGEDVSLSGGRWGRAGAGAGAKAREPEARAKSPRTRQGRRG